jgi:hypothetical protein
MTSEGQDAARLRIAEVLEAFANEPGWNDELWQRFSALLKSVEVDGLVAHADEELIRYSGACNAHNLLGFRVKPDKDQVADYKEQFRALARPYEVALLAKNTSDKTRYMKVQNSLERPSHGSKASCPVSRRRSLLCYFAGSLTGG